MGNFLADMTYVAGRSAGRVVVILTLGALLLSLPAAYAQASDREATRARLEAQFERSMLAITARLGTGAVSQGSGVVVSETGYVLTAAHLFLIGTFEDSKQQMTYRSYCMADPSECLNEATGALFAEPPDGLDRLWLTNIDELNRDNAKDFAILRLRAHYWPRLTPNFRDQNRRIPVPAICIQYRPLPGDFVYLIGFPNADSKATVRPARVESVATRNDQWRLEAPVDYGMSGGPVVDEKGRIIGTISRSQGQQVLVSPIRRAMSVLFERGVDIDSNCRRENPEIFFAETNSQGVSSSVDKLPQQALRWNLSDPAEQQGVDLSRKLALLQELIAEGICDTSGACTFKLDGSEPLTLDGHLARISAETESLYKNVNQDARYLSLAARSAALQGDPARVQYLASLDNDTGDKSATEFAAWKGYASVELAKEFAPGTEMRLANVKAANEWLDVVLGEEKSDWGLTQRAQISVELREFDKAILDIDQLDFENASWATLNNARDVYLQAGEIDKAQRLSEMVEEHSREFRSEMAQELSSEFGSAH